MRIIVTRSEDGQYLVRVKQTRPGERRGILASGLDKDATKAAIRASAEKLEELCPTETRRL